MTGCGCHDPAVFGHGEFCEDGLGLLQLRARRARGEGSDRALDRRLAELRADPAIVVPSDRALAARDEWFRRMGIIP